MRFDHVGILVDDLEAEQRRLAAHGVRFQGPRLPDELAAPPEMRGRRHLWTKPETAAGWRLQLTDRVASED